MKAQEELKKGKTKQRLVKDLSPSELEEFKAYDIDFSGRTSHLLFNERTGEIIIDDEIYTPTVIDKGDYFEVDVSSHTYKINISSGQMFLDGRLVEFSYVPSVPKLKRKRSGGGNFYEITAPLPGLIVGIHVKPGDEVNEGQKIITLEAMKMQNELVTERAGIVEKIVVQLNQQAETNQLLAVIKIEDT